MKKIIVTFALANIIPAFACTTFATFNGVDGAMLIAKNRDNNPDNQIIEVVKEKNAIPYVALSRRDVTDFVSAGVNKANLAVYNEVTIEYGSYAVGGIADDFSKDILQHYTTVDQVIPHIQQLVDKYPDPVFYQVADGKKLLNIEVVPNHKFSYTVTEAGTYAHTNNYKIAQLVSGYPYTDSEKDRVLSSQTRANRALELLAGKGNVTLADMQAISLDHTNGYNDSIFRTGVETNPDSVRSLAFFGVKLDPHRMQPAEIQARLYTQGERFSLKLDREFWDKYGYGYTPVLPNVKK